MTTIFFVATETSGDIHGANLARQLKAMDPTIRMVGFFSLFQWFAR